MPTSREVRRRGEGTQDGQMATTRQAKAEAGEHGEQGRLAETPVDGPAAKREREAFRLGRREYPVWTPAMVEARGKLRASGRKWYALHDKLHDSRNLREAWKQVAENGGAAGVSGETVQQYAKEVDRRLSRLAAKLKAQQFHASPIRRAFIPKNDGSGKLRGLGIPEIEDRIVQAAVVRLIEPIFEAKFLEGSYGFRPERSAHHALAEVEQAISGERPYLVDADIRSCFDSIPHEALMDEVAREIADAKVLNLIRRFVKAEIVERMRAWQPEQGTPQGAVLSPLLANIYLHRFDAEMTRAGYKVVRYADDFVVLCRTMEEAESARKKADEVLKAMGLELHPEKTRVIDARKERFQFLGYEWWPGGRQPRRSSETKLKDKIRKRTPRTAGKSMRVLIAELNPTLKGFYAYFRHSFHNVFDGIDGFIRRRLRRILLKWNRKRGHGIGGRAHRLYPNSYFAELKLFSMGEQHRRLYGARKLIAFPAKA